MSLEDEDFERDGAERFVLDRDAVKQFIAGGCAACPACGSEDLEERDFEPGETPVEAYRDVECLDCGRIWRKKFDLTGLEAVEN
jgi:Zn ribbon nucleic-acid-binding protein